MTYDAKCFALATAFMEDHPQMKPITARRTLLASLVLLTGCATIWPPEPVVLVAAGSSVCTAPTLAECERLSKIAASLNTPEMDRLIEEAKSFEVVRK